MASLNQRTLFEGNIKFIEFQGALIEQYVCRQLKTLDGTGIYYYTNDRNSCEVDFVIKRRGINIPLEVKSEINMKSKSLKTYHERFSPELSLRASMADYKDEKWQINLPLYAIENICEIHQLQGKKVSRHNEDGIYD